MVASAVRPQFGKPPKLKPTNFQPLHSKHGSPLHSPVQSFLTNSTLSGMASPNPSPNASPSNNTFLEDARSDISNLTSSMSRRGSIGSQPSPGDGSGMLFVSKLHSHYGMFVKMLPILIIFLPSLLKLFFPGVIKVGGFQLGDDKNHPSAIVVDIFSVLLICWILKFLLDWPWKWYLQISDLETKLKMYLEGHVDKRLINKTRAQRPDTPLPPKGKFQDITEKGLSKLHRQHTVALLFCVLAPFLCGGILLFSRKHIILIGTTGDNDYTIFTDLNIGIFVSCGLIRVIIQLSEQIQRSTAAIEASTEKMIQTEAFECMESELSTCLKSLEEHTATAAEVPQEVTQLQEQLAKLEGEFKHLSIRFELFYSKNKFIIEGDMSFLSNRHFKMLEKEINELNHKLQNKTIELEQMIMQVIRTQPSSSSNNSDDTKENKRPNSLHGMPLGKTTPTYGIDPNSGTPLKYPIAGYLDVNGTGDSFGIVKNFLPLFGSSKKNTINGAGTMKVKDEVHIDEETLRQLESLHEQGYLKIDLSLLLPLVKFLFSLPYLAQRMFWKIISYIPSQVLRVIYFLLLQALDALVEIYHKNQREMNRAGKLGEGKIQEVGDLDEKRNNHEEEAVVQSPKKRRYDSY